MHRLHALLVSVIIATAASFVWFGCGRKPADHPAVVAEKARWISEGWEFVTVVGEPHGTVEARGIRHSDPNTGSLRVIAPAGDPGSRRPEQERTFQEQGYRFLEVKIMTSPASGYGIVFRKKA